MSSSEHSSSESDETGNESLPDLNKLKPYDLEPRISSSDLSSSSNGNSDSETAEESRIGNVDWCLCGKCLPMTSYTESICCFDISKAYPYTLLLILHILNVNINITVLVIKQKSSLKCVSLSSEHGQA